MNLLDIIILVIAIINVIFIYVLEKSSIKNGKIIKYSFFWLLLGIMTYVMVFITMLQINNNADLFKSATIENVGIFTYYAILVTPILFPYIAKISIALGIFLTYYYYLQKLLMKNGEKRMYSKKKIDLFVEELEKIKEVLKDDNLSIKIVKKSIDHCIFLENVEKFIMIKLGISTMVSIVCYLIGLAVFYDYFKCEICLVLSVIVFILTFNSIKQKGIPITSDEKIYLNLAVKEKTLNRKRYDVIHRGDKLFYIDDLNKLQLISEETFDRCVVYDIYCDLSSASGYIYFEEYREIDFDNLRVIDNEVFGGVGIK